MLFPVTQVKSINRELIFFLFFYLKRGVFITGVLPKSGRVAKRERGWEVHVCRILKGRIRLFNTCRPI